MLTNRPVSGTLLCMKGTVRRSRANFLIDMWWEGERLRLYSDKDGMTLDSRQRADRLLSHIRYEVDHGTFDPSAYSRQPRQALMFESYAAAWLERQQIRVRQHQIARGYVRSVESYTRNYLVPFFKGRSIRDIYEGMVEDFLLQLPDHLSAKTRHNIMSILKKVLVDAHRRREITRIPEFPKLELREPEIKYLTLEEQEALLSEIACPIKHTFFSFLMRTGCRHGEARALRWERLNIKEGYAVIAAAMDEEEYRESTKEKNVRVLPLSDDTIAELLRLPRSLSGFVFTTDGKPLTMNAVWHTWNRAAKRLGITVNPYQGTRHSLATQLVNDGVSLGVVQDILGHKTPEMVRRYAKFKLETLRAALNQGAHREGPKRLEVLRPQ